MKIALLMNANAYAGREYLKRIKEVGIGIDIVSFGDYPEIDKTEEDRCGGLWTPAGMQVLASGSDCYQFDSLRDPLFIKHLSEMNYDLGVQGGTGIIKIEVIKRFRLGILNFHPGDLPEYRGCSAPEWQVFHGRDIVCTCHLIDEGIDSGMIYKKKMLQVDRTNYRTMRASIYPEIATVVAEVLKEVVENGDFVSSLNVQDESLAVYRHVMGAEELTVVKQNLDFRKRGLK